MRRRLSVWALSTLGGPRWCKWGRAAVVSPFRPAVQCSARGPDVRGPNALSAVPKNMRICSDLTVRPDWPGS